MATLNPNAVARGSNSEVTRIKETTFGVTPATPTMTVVRTTGSTLGLAKDTFESEELSSERGVKDITYGNRQANGDINFEFSYGSFEDFMESALFGTWNTLATISGIHTMATTGTGTGTVSGVDFSAFVAGDFVRLGGYANSANNVDVRVTASSGTDFSFVTLDGADVVNEAGTGDETATRADKLVQGSDLNSFTIETALLGLDTDIYRVFTGMVANTMSLTIPLNAPVTGTFGFIGKGVSAATGSTIASVKTPANENPVMNALNGVLFEGDAEAGCLQTITLNITNNLEPAFELFATSAKTVIDGKFNCTIDIAALIQNADLYNKFVNESQSSMYWQNLDTNGNAYYFYFPRIKYTDGTLPQDSPGALTSSNPATALTDTTFGSVMAIYKLDAR